MNREKSLVMVVCFVMIFCIVTPFRVLCAGETSDYVHYRLGVKYKNEKKLELAIEEFRKVLAAYPDNYNTYMHLAEIREYQGQYRLAIFNLKKTITYNPGWGKAQKLLSSLYAKDGQYQNAIKELQEYHQVCDPEERDSIQFQIERLVTLVKYGGREDKAGEAKASEPAKSQKENAVTGAKKAAADVELALVKTTRRTGKAVARDNPAAEKEFLLGVSAYGEAVSSQNTQLYEQALLHLRNTLKMQPEHAGAFYYAALIRRRNGQNQMAKINFEKALAYPDLGYNAHFYLGKIYGEEKQYKEAIAQLSAYSAKTDYEPGKREAQSLIERYTAAYNAMHEDTLKVDIQAIGREDMHREISKVPEEAAFTPLEVRIDSLLYLSIVDTLTEPGQAMLAGVKSFKDAQFDEAIENFKKVLISYPSGDVAARCVYDIGVSYMKLKNYSAAESKFQQVSERHHSHPLAAQSLFLKALSYYERHEPEQAEKLFRKFIQEHKGHAWYGKAYEKLGDAYTDLMQDKKAVDAFTAAAESPKSPVDGVYALYKLGNAYKKIGNSARAIEAFQKAIMVGEKSAVFERIPDSYYRIADHYYQEKDYAKALDYYQKVTRKYPAYQDTPWGLFQIASIYKNTKKYDKAIVEFKELIKAYPDDYWARQAEWKLEDAVWEYEYRAVLK